MELNNSSGLKEWNSEGQAMFNSQVTWFEMLKNERMGFF